MKVINYSTYYLSIQEYFFYGTLYFLVAFLISFLFYDSIFPMIIFVPLIIPYYHFIKQYLCNKQKNSLLLQFRDMINSISVCLSSGYSLENAFIEAQKEMSVLHTTNSFIYKELVLLHKKISLNIPVETSFTEFAKRSDCDDIFLFSEILITAKRQGGDLIHIIKNTSDTIRDKIDIQREIKTTLSSRLYEQNLMFIMPICIMLYIRISSPDFFSSVYHNSTGIIIMTFFLIVYILAILLGIKLTNSWHLV